jgi:hypothetical protein
LQDDGGASVAPGLIDQLRGQHWAVKLILGFVALTLGSPFLGIGGAVAYDIAQGPGLVLYGLFILIAYGWFVFTRPASSEQAADGAVRRYCESCGTSFSFQLRRCPACGAEWTAPDEGSIPALARFLSTLGLARQRELLDAASYRRLKAEYERRIAVLRPVPAAPPEEPPAAAIPPAPAVSAAAPAAAPIETPPPAPIERPAAAIPAPPAGPGRAAIPARPAEPRPSATEMGRSVIGWAAERQADILLYVGAFLLSIAAVIFVAYQGEELSGGIRFAVLAAYAAGFLVIGLLLHRWERVKEAGPVFLALGAILIPIDFVALRTQVLGHGQLPDDVLWLIASSSCAALYLLLALRGYGRLYFVPVIPAVLVAWGSLASVLNLPLEWWGVWYLLAAAPGYVAAVSRQARWRPAPWLLWFSVVLGALATAWTHLVVGFGGDHHAAMPVADALATAGLATGLRWRADTPVLAVLPPLASLTAASAWWAAFGLGVEWQPVFVVLAGAGYLVAGHFQDDVRAVAWGWTAATAGALGLLWAHLAVLDGETSRAALPAAYGVAFAAASGAFGRWRWAGAAAILPPLGGMALTTAAWASGAAGTEWYGAIAVVAGWGYLALAAFDRPDRTRGWQGAAAACAAIGVAAAHTATAFADDLNRWALPGTYALVLGAACASTWRWRWSWLLAPGAIPAAVGATAASAAWAQWQLNPEWYPPFAAATGLGYLVVAQAGEQRLARAWGAFALLFGVVAAAGAHVAVLEPGAGRAALPAAYAMVLAGVAVAYARWRWVEAGTLLPPVAAMLALTIGWAHWDLQPEWYPAFVAAVSPGYLALALSGPEERRSLWWGASLLAALIALPAAHLGVAVRSGAGHAALPVTYAIITLAAAAAFAVWRFAWRVAPGALPALLAMTTITASWAWWDVPIAWYGAIATAAACLYIAWALADEEWWRPNWLRFALAAGAIGTGFTQVVQFAPLDVEPARAALPVAYGVALAGAAFAASRWRWACREAVALVPPLAAAFGASLLWVTIEMPLEWLPAWMAAASAGYLAVALLDTDSRASWQQLAVAVGVTALAIAHAVAANAETVRWQLPLSYAVLLGGWSVAAWRLRDASLFAPPILAASLGAAALWAAEVGPQWWPYPALAVAAVMMAAAGRWRPSPVFGPAGWPYALALTVVPAVAVLPADASHHGHGIVVQIIAACLVFAASLASDGAVGALLGVRLSPRAKGAEWAALTQGAFAFLFGAGASLNGLAALEGAERAWVFAALSLTGWVLAGSRWRGAAALWAFAPVGLTGTVIASSIAADAGERGRGVLAAALALATVGPLFAFLATRRWALIGLANSFLFLAIWAAWRWQELDLTYLPLAFAVVATAEWTALTGMRRYTRQPSEPNVVIEYISWGPWLLSAAVSGSLLSREQARLEPGQSLVTSEEWGLAAVVLGLLGAAVTAEGFRLRRRLVWAGGSVLLLGALLMAIATREPGNVQAFTAPIGIYLAALALTFRRSPAIAGEHLQLHEGVMLAGALFLVIPPAEQSFDPGGGKFGLELLGIGIALLLVGLLLHARWLVAAAIATLTATATRMVTGGLFSTPYWLLFGLAGTALLAFGFLVLLERERWDRFRHRVVRWWLEVESAPLDPPAEGEPPAAGA